MKRATRLNLLLALILGLLASCSVKPPVTPEPTAPQDGAPLRKLDPATISDAVPRVEPVVLSVLAAAMLRGAGDMGGFSSGVSGA